MLRPIGDIDSGDNENWEMAQQITRTGNLTGEFQELEAHGNPKHVGLMSFHNKGHCRFTRSGLVCMLYHVAVGF